MTTWVSWHQKAKPFLILMKQEMIGWQSHHLHHMQIICTSLQTYNQVSTLPLTVYNFLLSAINFVTFSYQDKVSHLLKNITNVTWLPQCFM